MAGHTREEMDNLLKFGDEIQKIAKKILDTPEIVWVPIEDMEIKRK